MGKSKKAASSEKRPEKNKAKNARRMIIIGAVVIFIIAAVVVGCFAAGVFEKRSDISLLAVSKDGTVISEEVETLGEEYYTKAELKSFVKEAIKEYNDKAGAKAVKMERLLVKGEQAYLRTVYKTAEDYQAFTGYGLFAGTVAQAKKAGYDFADAFIVVKDGAKGDGTDVETVTKDEKANVVVLRQNTTVKVDGKILYVSGQDTEVKSGDTVTISQTDGNQDATDLTYIIYQ